MTCARNAQAAIHRERELDCLFGGGRGHGWPALTLLRCSPVPRCIRSTRRPWRQAARR
jgi:hypothetical protein